MMSQELKIVRKVLMGYSFNKDGYEYRFLSIDPDEKEWSYNIVVDVTLPKKGQSYATPVFSGHIHDILSNIWKYIGTSFSYSEKILVDGEEPVKGNVYISPEKQKDYLNSFDFLGICEYVDRGIVVKLRTLPENGERWVVV